ncbi:hypothetical protein SPAN111604_00170 [Sphingomonas antarctica]|uniref:PEPxxWA-CTERM sorting domain-containing protein n=1 Tax=Sphingomonas antarctica TaxID=2040274 RepID=UPI0039E7D710
MRAVLLSAVAALTIAAPAHAVSFFSLGAANHGAGNMDPGLAAFETSLVTFDGAMHSGVSLSTSGTVGLYTGTSGVAAAPVGDTSQYLALGTGGSATLDFASYFAAMHDRVRSLSVYVGSVDTYNTIEILNLTGNVIKTITGSDLPGQNGDQGAALTNRRLYINFDPSENVGALRFSSTGVAFEFDTIGASTVKFDIPNTSMTTPNNALPAVLGVPEPASWALMIGGFGVVGGALRRRQRVAVRFA